MEFKNLIHSKKFSQLLAIGFLACLIGYGVFARIVPPKPILPKVPPMTYLGWQQAGPVKVNATLSQNKVLQGSDGLVYMQIDMEAQDLGKNSEKKRVPTDFVIVLDRSGSMSGQNKMSYAIKAIESLLWQLGEDDRFSLVTFDDRVEIPINKKQITKKNRDEIIGLVKEVTPRGSTNLGSGLQQGIALLRSSKGQNQAQRLILVSDGMANQGITDVNRLSQIAAGAVQNEFVISTIGVGLDFNETLLGSLADYGTGNYYFLENVSKLDKILADEFYGASQILAKNLQLKLNLASGIQIIDASGYPIDHEGGDIIIRPGHLYENQNKSFFVTLKLPTKNIFAEHLGQVHLTYDINNQPYDVALFKPDLTVACLSSENREEVEQSIDRETFTKAWTQNNFGNFMKEGGGYVGKGDLSSAKGILANFRKKLTNAYEAVPSPQIQDQISKLDQMEQDIDDAFVGEHKDEKQKRLSKELHYEGSSSQRVTK